MDATESNADHYLVDDLEIDVGKREITRGTEVLALPGLSFDLFLALVRAAPNVLSHDEMEERVWNGRPVSPETLTQRVKLVRDALGDSSESPLYITVVRGRGYRLCAPVNEIHDQTEPVAEPGRRLVMRPIILSAITGLSVLTLVLLLLARPEIQETDPIQAPEIPSIAVLPFDDLSADKDREYFSEGMSETLIRELAQVTGLKVIARHSSFYFKDKEVRIVDIGSELLVGHVLEGSVQKSGDRIRVTARLIDVSDSSPVWSENFDRDLVDLFAVQDEIAREVVEALKVTLLEGEKSRLANRYQPSLEAYEHLILGRHEMAKRTADNLAAAGQHFKQAIELDPDYALAYVGLADIYGLQATYSGLVLEVSLERRRPLINKALELDPLSGEAYTSKATVHADRRELDLAEKYYLKAIELNPNYAAARQGYRFLLYLQGRHEEALAQSRAAAALNPMSDIIQVNVVHSVRMLGRMEEALTLVRRNIERSPEFAQHYSQMAELQNALGHVGEAQRWIEEARKRNPDWPGLWADECIGLLHLGDALAAEHCTIQFTEAHPGAIETLYVRNWLNVNRGELGAAISTQEAIVERNPGRGGTILLANLIAAQGNIGWARRLMAARFPQLLEDRLEIGTDLRSALVFAAVLHAHGERERRDVLLRAMEVRMATMHRIRGQGYGVVDLYIHAMRGDRDQAIAALREAIDMGWRVYPAGYVLGVWWTLGQDWRLDSLHQDPEFIALLNELEADILEQRKWYEENKDKPLL